MPGESDRPARCGWRTVLVALALAGPALLALAFASCAAPPLKPPSGPAGALRGSLLCLELAEARGEAGDGRLILEGLAHPEGEVRARAARAAGRWGAKRWAACGEAAGTPAGADSAAGDSPLPALLTLARADQDVRVREEALFALGQLGDPSASAVLASLALAPSPPIRAWALEALAKLPGTPASLLAASLADPSPIARGAAALALARRPRLTLAEGDAGKESDALAAQVARALEVERDEGARWKLSYLLSVEFCDRPDLRKPARAILESPNFLAASFAARALEKVQKRKAAWEGPEDLASVEALAKVAGDPARFWIARAAAAAALGSFLPPAVRDSDAGLQAGETSAEASLARLAGSPGFAAESYHVRTALLGSLARGSSPETKALLSKLDPAPSPPVAERRSIAPSEFFPAALRGRRRDPRATIEVRGRGRVRIQLFLADAPQHVAEFARLARSGCYDQLALVGGQRALESAPGIDGRDPRPSLRPEPGPELFLRGTVGAGLLQGSSPGSFFITYLPAPNLDGAATVLGRVILGMEVVDRVETGDVIEKVTIEGWEDPPGGG